MLLDDLRAANTTEKKEAARVAVEAAATSEDKKEVAAAAIDALDSKQRKELIQSMWPTSSSDRKTVYLTGFIVAGTVALGLAGIAWGASSDSSGIATSIIVLATGFSSAILGGLLGAYIQR